MSRAPGGEEIRVLDPLAGPSRRLAGPLDLAAAGLRSDGYSLHDPAWDPAGERISLTWFDGSGWSRIAVVSGSGHVTALPAAVIEDPWEEGAGFSLASAQFLWGPEGTSGTFVAWDDDCGSLHRISGPGEAGLPTPRPLSGSPACRPFFLGTRGFWLFTEFGEEFTQRVVVADERGRELETLIFPQGRPPRVRWAAEPAEGRPAITGWWNEPDQAVRVLFTWEPDRVNEWRRERCDGDCAEALAYVSGTLFYVAGPPSGGRLMALGSPGAEPRTLPLGGVTDLQAGAAGRLVVTVREAGGKSSLWLVGAGDFAPGSRLR